MPANSYLNAFKCLFIFAIFCSCSKKQNNLSGNLPEKIDYNFHIRPILSDKCFKCHGPDANKREADLRLDTPEGAYAALKDNPQKHVIVPGKPNQSALFQRIISPDTSEVMPPVESNLYLSKTEISLIEKWIKQGAEIKPHWAFISPIKVKLPDADKDWVKNEIDYFTYFKMQEFGLSPNPEADKYALLKRVSLDLTGLPPSTELQTLFLNDNSPEAFEKLIDKLLANKHYGEKMALHWLDVARYADSHGYQDDGLRTMWPWRDWVIHAFNNNYPYDKFLTWQLAGDLVPDANKESILATGFNRNHKITQEGGVIDEEYRSEYVTDRTNTFGKAFLALTYECAKCHDHKYDPISQKDYFSAYAFFNQVPEKGIFGTIDASFADPPNMEITNEDTKSILNFIIKKDTAKLLSMVMEDDKSLRKTFVLQRGNYDSPGEQVYQSMPTKILKFDTSKYDTNRLGLSKWLVDKSNPLTARVFVNRLWEQFFGQGIVKTLGDFGMQGDLPSHPELLDWLAVDFMEHDWDIKRLIKKMLLSATYRQSSALDDKKYAIDPSNVYLSRSSRLRLPAELVRDLALASSGLLNNEIGGPSIKPYQPEGIWEVATSGRGLLAKYNQDHEKELYRRGIYVFVKRTVPPPNMLIFDASNRDQCEVQRTRTNTPLQALVMLNDPVITESARVLAENLASQKLDNKTKISRAFQKIVCRPPSKNELNSLKVFYENEYNLLGKNPVKAKNIINVGEYSSLPNLDISQTAALMLTIQVMYNLEETIVRI